MYLYSPNSTVLDSFIEENKTGESYWRDTLTERKSKRKRCCVKENMRLIYEIEDPTSSNVLFSPLVQSLSLIRWPSMLSDMLTPTHTTIIQHVCVYRWGWDVGGEKTKIRKKGSVRERNGTHLERMKEKTLHQKARFSIALLKKHTSFLDCGFPKSQDPNNQTCES